MNCRPDFPTADPVQAAYGGGDWDAFVTKVDPDGESLLYSTHLGGLSGDIGVSIGVDDAGSAYVLGVTGSSDLLTTVSAFQPTYAGGVGNDAFIAKIAAPDQVAPTIRYATTRGTLNQVDVVFSESLTADSAINPDNYTLDHGASVSSAEIVRNSKTARLTTSALDPVIQYTVTVNNVQDRGLPTANAVAPDSTALVLHSQGTITRKEYWDIVYVSPGYFPDPMLRGLNFLTSDPKFPDAPDVAEEVKSIEWGCPTRDNFGIQFQGYVHPPVSGDYVFYLCATAEGALFLSTDANPANKCQIAYDWCGQPDRTWLRGQPAPSPGDPLGNISTPVYLEGGRKYYIEALMQNSGQGGANLGVTWRKQGDSEPANGSPPITEEYLSPYTGDNEPPTITCPENLRANTDVGQCFASGVDLGMPTTSDDYGVASVVNDAPTEFPKGVTVVTWTATDTSGNTATCEQTVTVVDAEQPTIVCPADVALPCSVEALVPADYTATATDNCDDVLVATCDPPSGSGFKAGSTTVTATATDSSGNSATCTFTVTRAPLGFTGFLPPIDGADATGGSYANPVRAFKLNSTIPVKFTAACDGAPVLSGVNRLQAIKYSDETNPADPIDATPQDAATTGNQFVLKDGEWHFNLDTKATAMSMGRWLLVATLSDGSQHSVWIQIK